MVGSLHDPMGPDFLLDKHGGHDKPWFNVGSESPQLIIHAFVKAKGVQSYTVELSDAYPSMGKKLAFALLNLFEGIVL